MTTTFATKHCHTDENYYQSYAGEQRKHQRLINQIQIG